MACIAAVDTSNGGKSKTAVSEWNYHSVYQYEEAKVSGFAVEFQSCNIAGMIWYSYVFQPQDMDRKVSKGWKTISPQWRNIFLSFISKNYDQRVGIQKPPVIAIGFAVSSEPFVLERKLKATPP